MRVNSKIVLVFGSGQVARELDMISLPNLHVQMVPRAVADITDADVVRCVVRESSAAIVINAAAFTEVEAAEDAAAEAFAVNRDGAGNVAEASAACGLPLIHLSTDYGFDGIKGSPYQEHDLLNPLNVYGKSKVAGEIAVRDATTANVIIRTSGVFAAHGHNFLRTILRLADERVEIAVTDDQLSCPTPAAAIATALLRMSTEIIAGNGKWGIWHYGGTPSVTWYSFAEAIFQAAERNGMKMPVLRSISSAEYGLKALRPTNSALDCAAIVRDWGIIQPHWRDGVEEVVAIIAGKGADEA